MSEDPKEGTLRGIEDMKEVGGTGLKRRLGYWEWN